MRMWHDKGLWEEIVLILLEMQDNAFTYVYVTYTLVDMHNTKSERNERYRIRG